MSAENDDAPENAFLNHTTVDTSQYSNPRPSKWVLPLNILSIISAPVRSQCLRSGLSDVSLKISLKLFNRETSQYSMSNDPAGPQFAPPSEQHFSLSDTELQETTAARNCHSKRKGWDIGGFGGSGGGFGGGGGGLGGDGGGDGGR